MIAGLRKGELDGAAISSIWRAMKATRFTLLKEIWLMRRLRR